ncbi:UDP-glycosyltransferase 85A1 isoform X3 [Selaginella moellendorffii]|uniref:UDP-glycosyltransferase 85A1 isoform X3 n=1 Tax=Selaginella moellendorffii TaxID=88036 RepID=UPI000D1D103C|nr:UDP-glycosyltransferase 85A1 isoform X3 [Selaginella moellendorffii]|eukprot:XP_024521946.1 UDP-glycosyltransferase 85A1 isoform X3 [Selaginella moellendorffii]
MRSLRSSSDSSSPSSKIHVVVVPLPEQGHMSPMIHLCKLIARDPSFTISLVNVDSLHDEFVKHWVAPAGLEDLRLHSIPYSWQLPLGADAHAQRNLAEWFTASARELPGGLEDLIRKLGEEGDPVNCIISDYFCDWSQDVADVFGIPRIILWSGTAAWTSLEYHIPELLEKDHIFPSRGRASADEANSVIIDYVRGVKPLRLADVPTYLQGDEVWKEICIKRSPVVKRARWVLVNSFYDLEAPSFDFMASELGPRFIPAGPLFLLDNSRKNVVLRPENEDCLHWMDAQERGSVLYISFGSIAVLSVEQFEELAGALEASKKPFLWVIRPELVVGGHSNESYNGFCERTKNQGFIVSWAPQLRVLAHPSMGAFLTHCGWNSVQESIANGIPMLGWPYGGEQNTNCKFIVEDWKIGVRFSKTVVQGLIERGEIEAGIRKVMDSEEGKKMKERVENLKILARKAMDKENGKSFRGLQGWLEDLKVMKLVRE